MGVLASDLKLTIHPHPTLSETVMEAADVYFGESAHVYKPKKPRSAAAPRCVGSERHPPAQHQQAVKNSHLQELSPPVALRRWSLPFGHRSEIAASGRRTL